MFVPKLNTTFSSTEIAELVSGELVFDAGKSISLLCSLNGKKPEGISFYKEVSQSIVKNHTTDGSLGALLLQKDAVPESLDGLQTSLIVVDQPHSQFVKLIDIFFEKRSPQAGIHPQAVIEDSAEIDPSAYVGPFSYIGKGCKIAAGSLIHPHVTIYSGASIGAHTEVHSGAVIREGVEVRDYVVIQNGAIIGADGFGYIPDPQVGLRFVPQVGNVVLESRSEVGANTCIDRAAMDATAIGSGSKVDNLVQIGHNTTVGAHSIICGQSAIAGSCKIGNQVILGGNVGVADHTEISDGCRFAAFSGLHGNYSEKGDYAGNPAMTARTYRRVVALTPKLPDLFKKLKKLIPE